MADPVKSYCADMVEKSDGDRYVATLFAREPARERLFTLYAFNAEVAKTRDVVTEPILGYIRLEWWREAIDEIAAGTVREHEVVRPLAAAIAEANWPVPHLKALIDARERDLDATAPASLGELRAYAVATSAPLFAIAQLTLMGVKPGNAGAGLPDETVEALAAAWSLTGLIRAMPHHIARGRRWVPDDVMVDEELHERDYREGHDTPAFRRVVKRLRLQAEEELVWVRKRAGGRHLAPITMLAGFASGYLGLIRRYGDTPFVKPVQNPLPDRVLRGIWASVSGRPGML